MIWINKLFFNLIILVFIAVIIEALSTMAVYYKYKSYNSITRYADYGSTVFILKKTLTKYTSWFAPAHELQTSSPKHFFIANKTLGYINQTGKFNLKFYDSYDEGKYHQTEVNILNDGSRFVGNSEEVIKRNVWVFGDSFVFGWGVSDEHTFTHLLQQKYSESKFYLYASGGWSSSNALINVQSLGDKIGKEDIVILGYANFYKIRNVAAPSRMREHKKPNSNLLNKNLGYLRYFLTKDKELEHEIIPFFCEQMPRYCEADDPSKDEANEVTIRIINKIASLVEAKVFLLHFEGPRNDEVLSSLDPKIQIIPATEESFSYIIRDSIMEFDSHPGPFWHHAIYTRISERINEYIK